MGHYINVRRPAGRYYVDCDDIEQAKRVAKAHYVDHEFSLTLQAQPVDDMVQPSIYNSGWKHPIRIHPHPYLPWMYMDGDKPNGICNDLSVPVDQW